MNRSGQPSPLRSPTDALKVQSVGPLMPAAAAWSVIVTGTGAVGGGVFGGGPGAGPTPGAVGSGGTAAGVRLGRDTGPVVQFACSKRGSGPCRPTATIVPPDGAAARAMSWSLALVPSAETVVVQPFPL